MPHALAGLNGAENLRFLAGTVGGQEHAHRMPAHLIPRITVQLFGAGIPAFNDAVEILSDDCVLGRFDDRRETQDFDAIQLVLRRLFHDAAGTRTPAFMLANIRIMLSKARRISGEYGWD
jgi:hypothetical protein